MGKKEPPSNETPILNILGERVALGPLRRDLLPLYERWHNDLDAAHMLGNMPGPVTADEELRWYEEQVKAEDRAFFTIYEREALRPVGGTNLFGLDFRNRHAGFGIVIGDPDFRGRGLGTEATGLMLDYAFTALGLHNVMLTVFEFNPAGVRAYEKAGFKEIGRRRECRAMGGRLWDEIYMDCLAPEFEGPTLGKAFAPDTPR